MEISVFLRSDLVTFGVALCSVETDELSEEEQERGFTIAFPMSGVFVRHIEGEKVAANPVTAVFMNRGDIHRVSHPAGRGDITLFVTLTESLVEPFLDPTTGRFPFQSRPTGALLDLSIRQLHRSAAEGSLEALEVEEALTALVAELVTPLSGTSEHSATRRAVIEDAKEHLTVHFADNQGMKEVARAVGASPHHLSRIFRASTGTTMSGFRTDLRLREALNRISDGADNLSQVAVEAGFFDHAHMTKTIRRRMDTTPTALRELLSAHT